MYSSLLKMIVVTSTLLITSGCASLSFPWGEDEPPKEVITIKTVEVKTPITHPKLPRAIQLGSPEYFVVSEKNLDEFLEEMTLRNGGNLVFVAHTIDDYELMAENVQEIKRYINQLKQVVIYYRNLDKKEDKDESKTTDDTKP